jgi:thioredoxin-like negative regulator of GroEL
MGAARGFSRRYRMDAIDDDPWSALLLAETRAATGRTKQALRDLWEAVKRDL